MENDVTGVAILIIVSFTVLAKKVHPGLGTQHGGSSPLSLKKTDLAGNPYSEKPAISNKSDEHQVTTLVLFRLSVNIISCLLCAQHKALDHLSLASVNCLVRGVESRV